MIHLRLTTTVKSETLVRLDIETHNGEGEFEHVGALQLGPEEAAAIRYAVLFGAPSNLKVETSRGET